MLMLGIFQPILKRILSSVSSDLGVENNGISKTLKGEVLQSPGVFFPDAFIGAPVLPELCRY